jgi:hypothetical protein
MQAPVLLERQAQLGAAEDLLERARAGTGGCLVFEGPAGIGKSSLLDAAAGLAHGMRVTRARPTELERLFAFGVVRDLFGRLIGELPREARWLLFTGPGAGARRVFEEMPISPGVSQAVFYGLFWVLAALATDMPVALIIDDAHSADAPTLSWLAYAAARFDAAPVAVLLATRDDRQPEELADLLAARNHVQVERVPTLGTHAVRTLLERAVGADAAIRLTEDATAATGGNPFLVGELLRGWWEGQDARGLPVTGTLRRQVARRIHRADPAAAPLAEAVAVLGGSNVPVAHAAMLAGLDEHEALAGAEGLRVSGVFADTSGLTFAHPLVREAVVDRLGPVRESVAHAAAARILRGFDAPEEVVAGHLLAAGPSGDPGAVDVLRHAARLALGRGAPETAVTLLRRARAEPPQPDARAAVLHELGQAESRANHPDAERTLRAALDAAADQDWADVALSLGRLLLRAGKGAEAQAVLQRGRARAPKGRDELTTRLEAEIVAAARIEPGGEAPEPSRAWDGRPDLRGATPSERLLRRAGV